MNFDSGELSEISDESEKLEELFSRVAANYSQTATPTKKFSKSEPTTLRINPCKSQSSDYSMRLVQSQKPEKTSLRKLSELSTFGSDSSFVSASFDDDDDDEIIEYLRKNNVEISTKPVSERLRDMGDEEKETNSILIAGNSEQVNNTLVTSTPVQHVEKIISSLRNKESVKSAATFNSKLQFSQEHENSMSSNDITEDEEDTEFGDYESYFHRKHLKQQKADENLIKWTKKRQMTEKSAPEYLPIFKGCIIYVNGYTIPGINEIHKLTVLHGGKFLHYFSGKTKVTHIIASKLTPKKTEEFKNLKVVDPSWFTDSIKAGKILNWKIYSIVHPQELGQKELYFGETKPESVDINSEKSSAKSLDCYSYIELEEGSEKELEITAGKVNDKKSDITQEFEPKNEFIYSKIPPNEVDIDIRSTKNPLDSSKPHFLKFFFENSRLHHLSTWKSSYKHEFIIKTMERYTKVFGTIDYDSFSHNSMIFYLDFDCYFAKVSSFNYRHLDFSKVPMCVSHGTQTSDVSSCNYVARSYGVKNGMWMNEAKKLCPHIVCLKYDFKNYERISRLFYSFILDTDIDNDIICVLPISVDECILQVKGNNEAEFIKKAKEIKNNIKSLTDCDISIGISTTKILSRLCLKHAKPNGIYYFDPNLDETKAFMSPFLFRDLPGVGKHSVIKLIAKFCNDYSISTLTVGHLYDSEITLNQLQTVFGEANGKKIYSHLQGEDENHQIGSGTVSLMKSVKYEYEQNIVKKDAVSIDINWGIRFTNFLQIEIFLSDLIQELVNKMAIYNKIGSIVTLKIMKKIPNTPTEKFLGMGHCEPVAKTSNMGLPTNHHGIILTETVNLFKQVLGPKIDIKDVRGVGVRLGKLVDAKKDKNQRKLNFGLPIAATKEAEQSFELPEEFNADVFYNLPKEIQNEIKLQHRSEMLMRKAHVNFPFKRVEPEVSILSVDSERSIISVDSSMDNSYLATQDLYFANNKDVDRDIFNDLPSSVQSELVNQWKMRQFMLKNRNEIDAKTERRNQRKKFKASRLMIAKQKKIRNPKMLITSNCLSVFTGSSETNRGSMVDVKYETLDYASLGDWVKNIASDPPGERIRELLTRLFETKQFAKALWFLKTLINELTMERSDYASKLINEVEREAQKYGVEFCWT